MLSRMQKRDCEWYKANLGRLCATHGACFAVISNKAVVATFSTFDDAADYGLDNVGAGKFIVQETCPDKSVHTMQPSSMWVTA